MKLTEKQKARYIDLQTGYFLDRDVDIEFQRRRVVKTAKPHQCVNAEDVHDLPAGSWAVADTAKVDGSVGTCYTCLPCLDKWAKEIRYDRR